MSQIRDVLILQNLISKYIDENELNKLICNSLNSQYEVLKELLKLKYDLIVQGKHQPINFPIKSLLTSDDFLNSSCLTQVLKYALLIQRDNQELLTFENMINAKISSVGANEGQLRNIFSLFDVAFDLIENHHFQLSIDNPKYLCKFYKATCNTNSKQLIHFTSVTTKRLAENVTANTLLICLETILISDNLNVLCCVIEYFLQRNNNSKLEICAILARFNIFEKISALINSYETINQRQGSFLLQQIKSFIMNNQLYTTTISIYIKPPEFSIEDVNSAWNSFFILLHISREKQIHLVKPALTFLNGLFYLHSLWMKTICSILFSHSQNEIVASTVVNILSSQWFKKNDNFLILHETLLKTLSKIDYSKATIESFDALGDYTATCPNDVFWVVLDEVCKINWNPINMWLFCKNIFKRKSVSYVTFAIINNYVGYLQKLPHKYIRSGCIKLCLQFLANLSGAKTVSFEDLLKLAMVVNDTDVSVEYFCDVFKDTIVAHRFDLENEILKWNEKIFNFDFLSAVQIVLCFWKTIDQTGENFRKFNFSIFPNAVLLKILINFELLIKSTDSVIVFRCLRNVLVEYEKIAVVDAKCLIKKLSSNSFFCDQNKHDILHLCLLAKNILESPDYTNCIQNEIALELLKNFDSRGLNSLNVFVEAKYTSIDCFSAGVLELLFKNVSKDSEIKFVDLIEMVYETGSDKSIAAVIQNLQFFLSQIQNKDLICKILDISIKQILRLNRGELFKVTLETYLNIFTSVTALQKIVPNKCYEIIQSVLELSQKFSFVSLILTSHLKKLVECCPEDALMYKDILIECLFNDACIRKEELSEYDVCKDICETIEEYQDNGYTSEPVLSRYLIFESILYLINNKELSRDVRTENADALAFTLIKKYKTHLNKRYFKDSMIHIHKLRIIQTFLLLQPHVVASKNEIVNLLFTSICSESHQHCVRQLIAWLLIRFLQNEEKPLQVIMEILVSSETSKISTTATLIPILYHVALLSAKEDIFAEVIDLLLPWTMGANFKLRVYAQIAIHKLYAKATDYKFATVVTKHKNVYNCLDNIILKAHDSVQSTLQTDEMIFDFFDPTKHYSLETILIHIPRINGVTYSEWEGYTVKVMCSFKEFESYHQKIKIMTNFDDDNKTNAFENLDIVQRKMTPWTEILQSKEQVKQLTNLVVVAVFVEKVANIGGLSRTCEIFGVKQLVVHDAKITSNKEYKSLSMCSEGWLNITEVKHNAVKDFLIKLKLEGYDIIAVEQTSNSVKLHKHQFQEKSVLVLGNEKEGIPANVLPLADVCVEIAQLGVTRSLMYMLLVHCLYGNTVNNCS